MKKTIRFTLLAIATILLASCKKEKAGGQTSDTNLLVGAPWIVGATEWKTTDNRWVRPPSTIRVSTPGATITFLSSHTFTTGSSSGSSGTWQLSGDGSQLILIDASGTSSTFTIATLNGSSLQLTTPLDKDTYVTEGTSPNLTYTYCTIERTSFSH